MHGVPEGKALHLFAARIEGDQCFDIIHGGPLQHEIANSQLSFSQIDQEFITVNETNGGVVGVDAVSGSVVGHDSLPRAQTYTMSEGPNGEFVVAYQTGAKLVVLVFDHLDGAKIREFQLEGIGALLADRDEILTGHPRLNPGWLHASR